MSTSRIFRRLAVVLPAALLAAAATATPVTAQEPRIVTPGGQPCSYDACVLRVEDGWFSRKLVRGPEGTVVARLGLGGPSLASVVAISDSAVLHAGRYQSAQRTGSILTTVGSLGTIAAVVALNLQDRDVNDEALAVNIAGLAVWVVGNSYLYKARRELSRSLWFYNRAVLGGGR